AFLRRRQGCLAHDAMRRVGAGLLDHCQRAAAEQVDAAELRVFGQIVPGDMVDGLIHLNALWSKSQVGRGLELARMRAAAWKARLAPGTHMLWIHRQQRCPDQAGAQRAGLEADTSRRQIQQRQIGAVSVEDDDPTEAVVGKALTYVY